MAMATGIRPLATHFPMTRANGLTKMGTGMVIIQVETVQMHVLRCMENQNETALLDVSTPISMDGRTSKMYSIMSPANGLMQITMGLETNTLASKVMHVGM